MQLRCRWYRIQLPKNTPDLSALLKQHPLGPDVNQGFTTAIGAWGQELIRFLWRSKVVITLIADDGAPHYQEVATVNFTDFAVLDVDGEMFLRIESPGRSIRDLLNTLESMVGLGFTCKPVTFLKKKPTSVLENVEVAKLIGLKVTDAVLGKDLLARMEFSSKEGINPEKLTVLDDVPHKTDSASYELIYGGVRGILHFSSTGTVKVGGQLAPRLIHYIEKDLAKLA